MKNPYKVLITASGTGSRLGDITQFINKALVRVGKKAAISYILDNIPSDVPITVTLGYKKEQVREYLQLAHSDRIFEFIEVDKYEGKGSSQAYSLLCAAPSMQCPFIYIACDTLFTMPLLYPSNNWLGVATFSDVSQYTTLITDKQGNVQELYPKGAANYDYAYVGLAGVHDYAVFWRLLSQLRDENPNDQTLNDVRAFSCMIKEGIKIQSREVENWLDIGNEKGLNNARKNTPDYFDNLEKLDESIYLFDKQFVIKFFHDPSIIQKRIRRARYLEDLVPPIDQEGYYFYRYKYISGELYSRLVNPENLPIFLKWCQNYLWTSVNLKEKEKETFKHHCSRFYFEKTLSRINQFFASTQLVDQEHIINQQKIPSLKDLFKMVKWNEIFEGIPSKFHGDLHFENILYTGERFFLLDWRQDFDGLIEYGDIYYDLAKLNHGMIVSHEIIRKNLFEIKTHAETVECEILRTDNLVLCQKIFCQFLRESLFEANKVEILTALIFLNIAPLHHHPYNLFLYFFGKLRLWYALCNSSAPSKSSFEISELVNSGR